MSEVLRGSVSGNSLSELRDEAKRLGIVYFGIKCQLIQIFDATVNPDGTFTGSFASQVHHRIEHRSYGPDLCRGCKGASWPHSKLPTAIPVPVPAGGDTRG